VRKKSKGASPRVRTFDVPVPQETSTPRERLESRLGRSAAARAAAQVARDLGVPQDTAPEVSAALALTRLGADLGEVARSLKWDEFEDYCAMAISAAGYSVSRNVRLRKPTRQIDIVAESPTLVLSVDCKHWRRGAGARGLAEPALAQAERTKIYSQRLGNEGKAFLPVILTMEDNFVRSVEGVPVVPLQALKEFLASVNRFDDSFSFVRQGS